MHLTQKDLDFFFGPMAGNKVNRYPLTDVGVDENENLHIDIAIAGFSKEDIDIELEGNTIIVRGEAKHKKNVEYIQQHISQESFERAMVLHENYVNGEFKAAVKDGILNITIAPRETKRKSISIT